MRYTGSVHKYGYDKNWLYKLNMYNEITKERKQKTKRGFKNKREAKQALDEALAALRRGEDLYKEPMTVIELFKVWFEQKKQNIQFSTLETYRGNIEKHILPYFGERLIGDLQPMDLDKFYLYLRNVKKLHANTIRKNHTILVNAFDYALKNELVRRNVVKVANPPKEQKVTLNVWETRQMAIFLKHAKHSPYYIAYLLAVNTGMRMGEILGLGWSSVDFENKVIHVKDTLSPHDQSIQERVKTNSSLRNVIVSDEVIQVLVQHQKDQKKRLKANDVTNVYDLVNVSTMGTPLNKDNLRRNFLGVIAKAGLPKIRFHDLRHSHATLLLKENIHPKVVSERLGHADTRMTLDRYSHVTATIQQQASEKFNTALSKELMELDDSRVEEELSAYV